MVLLGGAGLGQLIPIAVFPILSRIYTPEDFGVLAIFVSLASPLAIIGTGKYEMAILLPKQHSKAHALLRLSIGLSVLLALIVSIGIALGLPEIANLFGIPPQQNAVMWLIPLGFIGIVVNQVYSQHLNRFGKYANMAAGKITQAIGTAAAQIGFSLTGFGGIALAAGKLAGEWVGSAYYVLVGRRNFSSEEPPEPVKHVANEYRKFPFFHAPHALTNTVSANIPVYLLSSLFFPGLAGLYAMSMRLCYTPVRVFTYSTVQVFNRKASELHQQGESLRPLCRRTVTSLAKIGFLPFLALFLLAPQMFSIVLGEEWITAGYYARYLSPFLFLVFVVSPITYVPQIFGYQLQAFLLELAHFVGRVAGILLGFYLNDPAVSIIGFSVAGILFQITLLIWIFYISKEKSG